MLGQRSRRDQGHPRASRRARDESGEQDHTDAFVMAGLLVDAYRLRKYTATFDQMITTFLAK